MQRRTVLSLLLACTGVAVVGWLWAKGPGSAIAPPPPPGTAPAPEQQGAEPQSVGDAPRTEGPRVIVSVTELERFSAPPAPVRLAPQADGAVRTARAVAGVGAGFDAPGGRRGAGLLAVQAQGQELLRHVAVDPLQQPELAIGARVMVRGTVIDDQQRPVPGAEVWFGELDPAGDERRFAVDAQGAFEADVPMGAGVPFVVRAAGFASSWRVLTIGRRPGELRETLRQAATLRVQLAGMAVEIERARVFVLPSRKDVSSEVAQWPFFAQVRSDGYAVDARGEAVIEDLPVRGSVDLVVRHPRAALAAPSTVTLSRQPQRATVSISFGERTVAGRVVDEAGEPVVGAWLFGRRAGRALSGPPSARLLPPHLRARGVFVGRSGSVGDFSVGVPEDFAAQIAVRAPGFAGRDLSVAEVQRGPVALPAWRGGDAALQVAPPLAGSAWQLVTDLGEAAAVSVAADEPGFLALPACGRYAVTWRVEIPEREPLEFALPSLAVTGPVELPTAR